MTRRGQWDGPERQRGDVLMRSSAAASRGSARPARPDAEPMGCAPEPCSAKLKRPAVFDAGRATRDCGPPICSAPRIHWRTWRLGSAELIAQRNELARIHCVCPAFSDIEIHRERVKQEMREREREQPVGQLDDGDMAVDDLSPKHRANLSALAQSGGSINSRSALPPLHRRPRQEERALIVVSNWISASSTDRRAALAIAGGGGWSERWSKPAGDCAGLTSSCSPAGVGRAPATHGLPTSPGRARRWRRLPAARRSRSGDDGGARRRRPPLQRASERSNQTGLQPCMAVNGNGRRSRWRHQRLMALLPAF